MEEIMVYDSPIGKLLVKSRDDKITYLGFDDCKDSPQRNTKERKGVLAECAAQLGLYFDGKLKEFDLPLLLDGTEFQVKVWNALRGIPYGETRSYKDIAAAVGNAKAVRAVGGANNKNPICIIVPCHRVIAANGALSGFGGGIWRKEWLLGHEKK